MRGLRLLWLGAALGVALPVSAVAQPGWDAVTGLTPRAFVRIERLDGSGIQARVSAVDDAPLWGGIGAAIGFTDGVAERKYTVIYEAAALPNRDRP